MLISVENLHNSSGTFSDLPAPTLPASGSSSSLSSASDHNIACLCHLAFDTMAGSARKRKQRKISYAEIDSDVDMQDDDDRETQALKGESRVRSARLELEWARREGYLLLIM